MVESQENEQVARRELMDLLFSRRSFKSCSYPFRLNQRGQCACSNSYSYDCQYSLQCPSGTRSRTSIYINGAVTIICSN